MKLNNDFEDFLCDMYSRRNSLSRTDMIVLIKSYVTANDIYERSSLKSAPETSECLFGGDKDTECYKVLGRCTICEHSKWYNK